MPSATPILNSQVCCRSVTSAMLLVSQNMYLLFSESVGKCWARASSPELAYLSAAMLSPRLQGAASLSFLLWGSVQVSFIDGGKVELGSTLVTSMWGWDTFCVDVPLNASNAVFTAMAQEVSIDSTAEHNESCATVDVKGNVVI